LSGVAAIKCNRIYGGVKAGRQSQPKGGGVISI
jgi:hypothetical protein